MKYYIYSPTEKLLLVMQKLQCIMHHLVLCMNQENWISTGEILQPAKTLDELKGLFNDLLFK